MTPQNRSHSVYLWDTFDNETVLLKRLGSFKEAEGYVANRFGDRIRENGADRVEIVNTSGHIVKHYQIG